MKDHNITPVNVALKLLIFAFLFVAASALLSGCISMEKAAEKATKTEERAKYTNARIKAKYPHVSAFDCSTWFPVAESEVIPGKEEVTESEETQTETVPCKDEQGNTVEYVEVPKVRVVTRTVHRTDTIKVRDTAKEQALQLEKGLLQADTTAKNATIKAAQQQAAEYKSERNKAYWALGIVALAIGGLLLLKFLKPF